jgi:hypothetical protein
LISLFSRKELQVPHKKRIVTEYDEKRPNTTEVLKKQNEGIKIK